MKKAFLLLAALALLVGCKQPTDDDKGSEDTNKIPLVTFENKTQFYVQIHQDAFSGPVVLELNPGQSGTAEAQPSANYGVGSTYCVTYEFNVAEEGDIYNGKVFADGLDPNAQINFVIEANKSYTKNIPVPTGIEIKTVYLRIKNTSTSHFELAHLGVSYKQAGNQELPVPIGKTGIYEFSDTLDFTNYRLQSVFQEIGIPNFQGEKGYVYDFVFTNVDATPAVIPDVKWRIKPEPTTLWNKPVLRSSTAMLSDSRLNAHLASDTRFGISDIRSNYPVNKIITFDDQIVTGEIGFNYFTDDKPYEMPAISGGDIEWTTRTFETYYFYAGTSSVIYDTTFNDLIRLQDASYVLLATYIKGNRTGLWLFYLNRYGEFVSEIDIPPDSDDESLMGVRLLATSDGGFLVIGTKKTFSAGPVPLLTGRTAVIYKYMNQNLQWIQEHNTPGSEYDHGIAGVETGSGYVICTSPYMSGLLKTTVLKLDKGSGTVLASATLGSTYNYLPANVVSDAQGNVYIAGLSGGSGGDMSNSEAYIVKLDGNLNQIWAKEFGDYNNNYLFDILISGNCLIATGSGNNEQYTTSELYYYPWQDGAGWIVKLDMNTGLIVHNQYSTDVTSFNSIAELKDGGYAIAGIKDTNKSKPCWFDSCIIKVNEHLQF